jgi:hypothetical protein
VIIITSIIPCPDADTKQLEAAISIFSDKAKIVCDAASDISPRRLKSVLSILSQFMW